MSSSPRPRLITRFQEARFSFNLAFSARAAMTSKIMPCPIPKVKRKEVARKGVVGIRAVKIASAMGVLHGERVKSKKAPEPSATVPVTNGLGTIWIRGADL